MRPTRVTPTKVVKAAQVADDALPVEILRGWSMTARWLGLPPANKLA